MFTAVGRQCVNTTGRSLIIKFKLPGQEREPMTYLKECITELTNYLVDDVPDRDLLGVRIRNTEIYRIRWWVLVSDVVTR